MRLGEFYALLVWLVAVSFDPLQRFIRFVPGGNGVIYAIQADGNLYWYRHAGWQTGAASWSNGNGRQIGTVWHQFTTVLAAADGQIFAFRADGTLLWYRYILADANTGAGSWHPASGSVIGSGFDRFPRIFGGFDNVIYGVQDDGALFWYRYTGGNGSRVWADNGNGQQIGSGWGEFPYLWADPNGVIFGTRQGDTLHWWRHVVQNQATGAGYWANGGIAIEIGSGWGEGSQRQIMSNTSGVISAIALDSSVVPGNDDVLVWYRLNNSEHVDSVGATWANGGVGNAIGHGFTWQNTAALQGYPSSQSTPQGGAVGIKVSSTFSSYTATVLQVAPSAGDAVTVVAAATHPGRLQTLPSGYRSTGCGWANDFTVPIPAGWPSGVYAARLNGAFDVPHDVVFCVRPALPQHKIAVIIPTNTYNAYNSWGGHNQYTVGQDGVQRTVTMQRPSTSATFKSSGYISHTLFSDVFLLQWMTAQGIQYDCYTDLDVDANGSAWLSSYKAVVLASHPEYWTEVARQSLLTYLAGGGRVIYTGGNGIFERVGYSADRSAVIFRDAAGNRDVFDDAGLPTSDVLGIEFNAASYMDFFPYQVIASHPFLDGTGLNVGDTFGSSGYNGAASGWEVDQSPGTITGSIVIASGQNPNGGADMVYVPKPNNGWVFTASSIAFNGSIPFDSAIQQILTNAFAAAVA